MSTYKTVLSKSKIEEVINRLAQEIATDYRGKQVLLVGVLKGSFLFLADLVRALWHKGLEDFEVDFMGIASYGSDTESSKNPRITQDLLTDISGRHVLLVEDIVDTGHSLDALTRMLGERGAKSLKAVVLLSKESRREVAVTVDYVGVIIDGWVEGYGLDTGEKGRGRPEVIVRNED